MGSISIQSRQDKKSILHSNVLFDSSDSDDELTGFNPGDTVVFSIEIDSEQAKQLIAGKSFGIHVRENTFQSETNTLNYIAEIEFRIVKRSHLLLRDWMTKKIGFRSTGTLIRIEAVSNEAEELFLLLQKSFDANIEDLI